MTLVLTYHQLSDERSPLCIPPQLFSTHLETLAACDAHVVTAGQLARALRGGHVPERTVVLTFDDGFAGAVHEARPRLAAAGMHATFFCVAGHLGGVSDWSSRRPEATVAPLATADELAELARAGHEIGAHGWTHAPLDETDEAEREVVEARAALEEACATEVRTLAYPYGSRPGTAAHPLVQRTYDAAFGTSPGRVTGRSQLWDVPRVDAHYLRDPRLLRRAVGGSLDAYLGARRIGSRTRRAFRKDYAERRACASPR